MDMHENLREEPLEQTYRYKGKIINLRVDQARLPNGRTASREVVEHPGGVCIAALTEQNELLFVRQFRYPFQNVLLELPAGKLEPGETPLEAVRREQLEETGTCGETYVSLGRSYATPAYCTEQIHIWACRITSRGEQHLDPDEFLEVEAVPLERAVELVLSNQIPDAKTQIGILKTYALVKGGKL